MSEASSSGHSVQFQYHQRLFSMYLAISTDLNSIHKALLDQLTLIPISKNAETKSKTDGLYDDRQDIQLIKQLIDQHQSKRSVPRQSTLFYKSLHDAVEKSLQRMERICTLLLQHNDAINSSNCENNVQKAVVVPHQEKLQRVRQYAKDVLQKVVTYFDNIDQQAQVYQQAANMAAWGAVYQQQQHQMHHAYVRQGSSVSANALVMDQRTLNASSNHHILNINANMPINGSICPTTHNNPAIGVAPVGITAQPVIPKGNASTRGRPPSSTKLRKEKSSSSSTPSAAAQTQKDFQKKSRATNEKNLNASLANNEKRLPKDETDNNNDDDDETPASGLLADPSTAPLQILPSNNQFLPTSTYKRIFNPLLSLPTFESNMYAAEIWNLMQLYLPDRQNMDTFPLSYLIGLLGYDTDKLSSLLSSNHEQINLIISRDGDESAMELHKLLSYNKNGLRKHDPWYDVPPRGIFRDTIYTKQYSQLENDKSEPIIEGMPMLSIDPLYLKLLGTYAGNPNILGYPSNDELSSSETRSVVTLKSAPQRLAQPKDPHAVFSSFSSELLKYLNKCSSPTSFDNPMSISMTNSENVPYFDESKVTFRLGVAGEDEFHILRILSKTQTPSFIRDYYTESKLTHILFKGTKSVSDFIILCCDKLNNNVPVGFIHYQFNWYRSVVSPTSASVSSPIVANVVFNIVHVACIKNKCNQMQELAGETKLSELSSPLRSGVVLILLSMEHARSWDVHYGLIDVLDVGNLHDYFHRFFRAEECVSGHRTVSCSPETNENEQKVFRILPMVIDLAKTSYRYTLLQPRQPTSVARPKESMTDTNKNFFWNRRLIVQLPNKRDTTLMLQSGPEVLQYREKGRESLQKGGISSYKNADQATWNKRIVVKLEPLTSLINTDNEKTLQSNDMEIDRTCSVGRNDTLLKQMTVQACTIKPGERTHDDTSKENMIDVVSHTKILAPSSTDKKLNIKCPNWEIIRSFQIKSSNVLIESSGREDSTAIESDDTDEIFAALKNKQSHLRKLEYALYPQLAKLLRNVLYERLNHNTNNENLIKSEEKIYSAYNRTLEESLAKAEQLQAQIEADMNAVCCICLDGNITSDNQILFCESCNVAVHQKCYMIEKVPPGDWFCKVCRYFKRDLLPKDSNIRKFKPPICCELCPIKSEGAFVQMYDPNVDNPRRWIHVVCAKWSGLYYVESSEGDTEFIESVEPIKLDFLKAGTTCCICNGRRGSYVKCRETGCDNYVHLLCARLCGMCNVIHGDRAEGPLIENKLAWTLCCPTHSSISKTEIPDDARSISDLVKLSESFPPEPIPEPPMPHVDEFNSLSKEEREKWMNHPSGKFEKEMIQVFMRRISGAICQVCNVQHTGGGAGSAAADGLIRCSVCHITTHAECYNGSSENTSRLRHASSNGRYVCDACSYVKMKEKANEQFEAPQCNMCNMKNGALKKAFAIPISKKMRKNNPSQYAKTLFGKQIWCHSLCGLWNPLCNFHFLAIEQSKDEGDVTRKTSPGKKLPSNANQHSNCFDCTNVIMSNGFTHINASSICVLCGRFDRVKVGCYYNDCADVGGVPITYEFHLTCARQAGLDISDVEDDGGDLRAHCFRHARCNAVLRARLEDLLELEKDRLLNKGLHPDSLGEGTFSIPHASKLFHLSVSIMATLGWAWRWAEWWVEHGDNWEPLLEVGQNENEMTKEQLKIIDSSKESRCEDARRCRLAAFGAALRNREYDNDEEGSTILLGKALNAILSTKSLVGPLSDIEKEFINAWLGRAYRSKSPFLGFGDDAILVAESSSCNDKVNRCVQNMKDGSLKYVLGNRPLPGKHINDSEIYEDDKFCELDVDDFLREDVLNIYGSDSAIPNSVKSKRQASSKKGASSSKTKKTASDQKNKTAKTNDAANVSPRKNAKRKHEMLTPTKSVIEEATSSTSNQLPSTFPSSNRGKPKRSRLSSSNEKYSKPSTNPTNTSPQVTRKRGRPRKKHDADNVDLLAQDKEEQKLQSKSKQASQKKLEIVSTVNTTNETDESRSSTLRQTDLSNFVVPKRKRGRPPKKKPLLVASRIPTIESIDDKIPFKLNDTQESLPSGHDSVNQGDDIAQIDSIKEISPNDLPEVAIESKSH